MCKTQIKNSKITFEDGKGKTKMCFDNPNKRSVTKVKVDGCAITSGKRCDFMLLDHNTVEHYIELKGKQIEYACDQIEETIKKLSTGIYSDQKYAFIVSTACPLTTTEIQIKKALFKRKYKSTLIIKNSICIHCLG